MHPLPVHLIVMSEMTQPHPPIPLAKDGFRRLPTELILEILGYSSDFTDLWSLINASSACLAVFPFAAHQIVGNLINEIWSPELRVWMRAVLCLRIGIFEHPLSSEDMSWAKRSQAIRATLSEHLTRKFLLKPAEVASTLTRFVKLVCKIHGLTHICLEQAFRLCKPRKPESDLIVPRPVDVAGRQRIRRSWEEETRMALTLWRIQFENDMAEVQAEGSLAAKVPEYIKRLPELNLADTNMKPLLNWQLYCNKRQGRSAAAILKTLEKPNSNQSRRLPDLSFDDYFHWTCTEPDLVCNRTVPIPSFGIGMFDAASRNVGHIGRHWRSVFLRFGFEFWDDKSMTELGLYPSSDVRVRPDHYLSLFHSLPDAEREEAYRKVEGCHRNHGG
nr:hypothetical protein CFP56_72089 [Quercus suber]